MFGFFKKRKLVAITKEVDSLYDEAIELAKQELAALDKLAATKREIQVRKWDRWLEQWGDRHPYDDREVS